MTILLTVLTLLPCSAQTQTTVEGFVTDSISGEPLPYVSLILKGTVTGGSTDTDGHFSFVSSSGVRILEVSYLGYETKVLTISLGRVNNLNISLSPTGITMSEVIVKPGKERYSKKENPAVEFVRHVIERRKANDPRGHDWYSYIKYENIVIARNDYEMKKREDGKKSKFDFIEEFVDTIESGTAILPISTREKVERIYCRRSPSMEKSLLLGSKQAGLDEMLSREGMEQFLGEVFKEVNIFQNDIPLFLQRFVSPLSTNGPNYYKYYLMDTLYVEGERCADLTFVPFNSETFGFTGHLFVTLDSTYFVKKATLNVPKDINLNFISRMAVEQTYERTDDDTRLITKDDIQVNFKLSEKSKGLYARRLVVYTGQTFDCPDEQAMKIFSESSPVVTTSEAYYRGEDFWESHRPGGEAKSAKNTETLMARLRSVRAFYLTERFLSIMINGYFTTHKDKEKNKWEFGPMNSTFNGNNIEGFRMRAGGTTTPAFSRHLFLEGYVAYGTTDEKLKYQGLVEYSFNPRKELRLEYPRHSISFDYMYDINKLGQDYMYTSKDNMMLAIRRKKESRATYLRQAQLAYQREHYSGLSYGVTLRGFREYSTEYAEFLKIGADGTVTPQAHYDMREMELSVRFAKDEKFYQMRTIRVPITYDALIFNLKHVMAFKGVLGTSFNLQRTEIGVQKRFWFSAYGYADLIIKGGKIWNKVPYPLLFLPNVNLTYTIQPESYTNLNAMEFVYDEYAQWDLTYYLNGNLFNRIPLLKKLKWREVFCFRGLFGHLSAKNDPSKSLCEGLYSFPEGTYTLGSTPYMEASAGVENIFKFLRIDYVWRLNYLDNADIQRRGIRMTMHFTF